jgi:hypothetical protein
VDELIVLGLVVAVWWLPALRVIRDMDLIPGIPRPLFWSVLPVIGLPIVGPLFYVTWLRHRLIAIGANALQIREERNRARRARGAGEELGDPSRRR